MRKLKNVGLGLSFSNVQLADDLHYTELLSHTVSPFYASLLQNRS